MGIRRGRLRQGSWSRPTTWFAVARMAGVPARVRPHGRSATSRTFQEVPLQIAGELWSGSANPTWPYINPNRRASRMSAWCRPKRRWTSFARSGVGGSRALSEPGGCSEPGRRAHRSRNGFGKLEMPSTIALRGAGMAFRPAMLPRRPIRSSVSAGLGVPVGGLAGRGGRRSTRIGSGAQPSPGGLRAAPPPRARRPYWFISDYSSGATLLATRQARLLGPRARRRACRAGRGLRHPLGFAVSPAPDG